MKGTLRGVYKGRAAEEWLAKELQKEVCVCVCVCLCVCLCARKPAVPWDYTARLHIHAPCACVDIMSLRCTCPCLQVDDLAQCVDAFGVMREERLAQLRADKLQKQCDAVRHNHACLCCRL